MHRGLVTIQNAESNFYLQAKFATFDIFVTDKAPEGYESDKELYWIVGKTDGGFITFKGSDDARYLDGRYKGE